MLAPAELDGLLARGEAQLASVAAALRAACECHDVPAARREAHKLAGLAGSIGCPAVAAAARQIEAAATRTRLRQVHAVLTDLDRCVPQTIAALSRWRARLATSG